VFLFGKKTGPTLGLDINSSTISVIQLEKTKTDIKVARFSSMPTPPDIVREGLLGDPEAVGTAVRELLDLVGIPDKKPKPVVNIGIPGQAVVIRLMPVPVGMPADELNDVIRQEAINNLPFPVEEANLDFSLLPATERTDPDGVKRVDVILAAIQKIVVDSYWRMADAANVQLGKLDISSLASIRALACSGMLRDDNQLTMAVNIRNDATDITLIKKGMPLFSRSVLLGVETLGEAISRSIDSPMDEAISMLHKLQLGAVPTSDPKLGQAAQVARSVFGDLTAEVGRSLEFYMSQVGSVQVDQMILSGPGCVVPGLHDFVANRLNISTIVADPFQNIIYDKAQILEERRPAHTLLLGLVADPTMSPIKTVEVDLNKSGPSAVSTETGEEGDDEEAEEEVDTPWFVPALSAGVLSLLVAGGVWGVFAFYLTADSETQLAAIEESITTQKAQADQMAKQQEELVALRQKKEVLERIVNHGTPTACILQAVRDNIPQGVQVTTVSLTENNFSAAGISTDFAKASHYVINLDGSNYFENARLSNIHRFKKAPDQIGFDLQAGVNPEVKTKVFTQENANSTNVDKVSSDKPRVLYFYAQWCAQCKKVGPPIEQAALKFADKVDFVKIDVDDKANASMVAKYNAKVIPDVYIVGTNGETITHLLGAQATADATITAMDKVSKVATASGTR
jgi:type IV pilus assembly protein PilM